MILLRWKWIAAVGIGAVIVAGLLVIPASRRYLRSLVVSDFVFSSVRVTYPEGTTIREMADKTEATFPRIRDADFIRIASSSEGYLFPDTYFFPALVTATSVVATMRANFDTKTAPLRNEIAASGHSLSDVIIMASLLEKEVRTSENRRIVAGILWKRLALGMPLQVDAVFGYINGRDTYAPSLSDLKIESPYNLYLHKGLPPGPINNPGLDALDAAANPTKTTYLYYLTGNDNLMHYATTYAAHQANRKKYLK